jgi:hypothetical protein
MSKTAVDAEQAGRDAKLRLRHASRSEIFALLPAADRITFSRWARSVAALHALLALVAAVSLVAFHDRGDSPAAQAATLQRTQLN